jgi:hypothetical protein
VLPTGGKPSRQWFSSIHYTLGYLESYLYQEGVAVWDDEQEYYESSICKGSNGILYVSQSGTDGSPNVGNDPATDDGTNWLSLGKIGLTDNITVTVGAGGDYSTINDALAYLTKTYYPVYVDTGITATVNLLTGFVMAEQVLVRGLDLGWITITGDDAETTIDHTALTTDFAISDYGLSAFPAFGVSKGGTLPVINQLFRFSAVGVGGNKHGIMTVGAGSAANVLSGSGVADAGAYGIFAWGASTVNANSANASGAGTYGVWATENSCININGGDASGAGGVGIYANNSSTISAIGANASGAVAYYGIYAANSSTINAIGANASGATDYCIYARNGSTINAISADASGAGTYGICAASSSTINAISADASGAGTYGIFVSHGSNIGANGATGTLNQTVNTITNNGIIYQ